MSEKSLAGLFDDLRREALYTAKHYSCVEMLDARLARAEAAERFAEFAATHHNTDAGEEVYEAAERLLHEYAAAREAVRKLEKQT